MPPSTLKRLGRAIEPHRRRLALAVLVVAALVVGRTVAEGLPREVQVRYLLGPAHAEVTEVRVVYLTEAEEEVQGVSFRFPGGAPPTLEHAPRLAPGDYRILATLRGPGGSREVRRGIAVPTEAPLEVELFDLAYAARVSRVGAAGGHR